VERIVELNYRTLISSQRRAGRIEKVRLRYADLSRHDIHGSLALLEENAIHNIDVERYGIWESAGDLVLKRDPVAFARDVDVRVQPEDVPDQGAAAAACPDHEKLDPRRVRIPS